jgi:UDP-N-acetylglucosamine diphosphorylase/glucosamine-1-phosphate N-acetyltransferase
MRITLFDDIKRKHLLPLVFTKPCSLLRIGIFTISQKWEKHLQAQVDFITEDYLSTKYPNTQENSIKINGRILPNSSLIAKLQSNFTSGRLLNNENDLIAEHYTPGEDLIYPGKIDWIKNPSDIFRLNAQEIEADFSLVTKGKSSLPIPNSVTIYGKHPIFIEKGAKLHFCSLNSEDGPIYIGANAEVMEGSLIRGPFALCNNSTIKMGAKIYSGTTVGPHCKVGGEVNNSVFQGYSNKGHDGFLGNSVIGEWCNLGADTNNSNLKNNYDDVKLWDYATGRFAKTGLQFCGLIMGDHSKCGINTMFNTGTVIGVSANIFGSGFPRNFVPSFSWGGNAGFTTYKIEKVLVTGKLVMTRRGMELDKIEEDILSHIYNTTAQYRNWENNV